MHVWSYFACNDLLSSRSGPIEFKIVVSLHRSVSHFSPWTHITVLLHLLSNKLPSTVNCLPTAVRKIHTQRPLGSPTGFSIKKFPLAPVAQNLLSQSTSQAYVERVFSLCGDLTTGKRNRLRKKLEMRAFLKVNQKYYA